MRGRNEAVGPAVILYTDDWSADEAACRTLGLLAWEFLSEGWQVELAGLRRPEPEEVGAACGRDLRWCSSLGAGRLAALLCNLNDPLCARAARFLSGRMKLSFARSADLLVCWTRRLPPLCPASRGWLIVPEADPDEREVLTDVQGCGLRIPDREKQRRLESWERIFAPLEFVRECIRRRWKVDAEHLVLPLVPDAGGPAPAEREVLLLSGGRGHRRDAGLSELEGLFRQSCEPHLDGWKLRLPGEGTAAGAGVANGGRDEPALPGIVWFRCPGTQDCERCDVCWTSCASALAAAMHAGAVPVVQAGPAVRELVRTSGAGFVCKNGAEMASRTLSLAGSPDLLMSHGAKARQAAEELTGHGFVERVRGLIRALDGRRAA